MGVFPCHAYVSEHDVRRLMNSLCAGMPAHPAPVTDSSQLPRPQPSKQSQKNPPKRTNQPKPSDASTAHERAPAAQRASVNPCFAPFFPAPRQHNGSAAPAATQASQELGPAGRQCSSAAEEQRGSGKKAAAAPGVQERANGRTDSRAPASPSRAFDPQADCAPENCSSPAQPEAPGTHAMPPQQCPPLFPDARGPCTVLDLMPKDWARPFSGWACAYDASLGISHASQAYIRRMQRLRRRQPSMRRGVPQTQLHFSSWEVTFSSNCSHMSRHISKTLHGSLWRQHVVKPAGTRVAVPAWAALDAGMLLPPRNCEHFTQLLQCMPALWASVALCNYATLMSKDWRIVPEQRGPSMPSVVCVQLQMLHCKSRQISTKGGYSGCKLKLL